ncbi:hypothetical protein BH24GEM2_BH24GEM2_17020 [soil metagenome]|nr:cytochrome c [Gemmatimonadota bacterium]
MKRTRAGTLALLASTLLLLSGCGSARRGEPLRGTLAITHPQVAAGERVYMAKCQQCHPGGEGGLGPAINNKPLPGWLIKFQVRNGLGTMPAFSSAEIPAPELDALVDYLQTLRRHGT